MKRNRPVHKVIFFSSLSPQLPDIFFAGLGNSKEPNKESLLSIFTNGLLIYLSDPGYPNFTSLTFIAPVNFPFP